MGADPGLCGARRARGKNARGGARQRLEEAGIEVVEVAGPSPSILSRWWTLGRRRWREKLGSYRGTADWDAIDPELREIVAYGMDEVSGADYARAMDQCTILAMAPRGDPRAPRVPACCWGPPAPACRRSTTRRGLCSVVKPVAG